MATSTSHGRGGLAAATVVLLGLAAADAVSSNESTFPAQLRWLARHQQPDGSWGDPESPPADRVRLTGMALLNFLGTGYTHLSRETYDGIPFGHAIKGGIRHLMSLQSPEGRLTPGDLDVEPHAWAALALCEAFSLTESLLFKENAARSVAWLDRVQRPDGGWGGEAVMDPRATAVAAIVLVSAERGGLPVPKALLKRTDAALDRLVEDDLPPAASAPVLAAALLRKRPRNEPLVPVQADAIVRGLRDAASTDPAFRFWGLVALYRHDGPAGPRYKSCCHGVKDALVRSQIRDADDGAFGSWRPPGVEVPSMEEVPPALRHRLEALIVVLAEKTWAARERATNDLLRLGPDALPLLREAGDHDNPEVAARAGRAARMLDDLLGDAGQRLETTCLNGLTLLAYYRYDSFFAQPP
jgi:hypothetical protein